MIDVCAVTKQVRALEGMALEELRSQWSRLYGAPPRLRSPEFLARLLAWRIQATAFGGLDAETKALLGRKSFPVAAPKMSPGVRLERQWRGLPQVVDVVDGGFRWQGAVYPSLSKVALAITGVKWNGPRFFGLRDKAAV